LLAHLRKKAAIVKKPNRQLAAFLSLDFLIAVA